MTGTIAPVTGALVRVAGPVAGPALRRTGSLLSWLTHRTALRRVVDEPRRSAFPAAKTAGDAGARAAAHPAGGLLGHPRYAAAGHPAAPRGAVRIGTEYRPILLRPAPLPASPGPGPAGMPSTASVSHHHGGAVAVVPTAAATALVALRRLPAAAHVEVRRLIAESPTVSPD